MKLRPEKIVPEERDERTLAEEIRTLAGETPGRENDVLPERYWANLLVRTNRRIDDATSPKALSISWAARVAIPGVVAVLSFVVALHYYAPVQPRDAMSLASVVRSLPDRDVDSIFVAGAGREEGALQTVGLSDDMLQVSKEQIAEYFIDNGRETQLVELL
ncbi:MAG: hypothetical protein WB699_10540, partial [Bacteroidota bacterium]